MNQQLGKRHWGAGIVAVFVLLGISTLAAGQIRISGAVALPGLNIGVNIPAYPKFAPIPGYPVYYAPELSANLFFYDGLYWALAGDEWYYSSWYDGPWYLAEPEVVPDFMLRIPIRYYRRPPAYFRGWDPEAAPRWGDHWGPAWEQRRGSWDRWNRAAVPPRAPLPTYQRRYPRSRYPGVDRQRTLENSYYPYRPREPGDRSRLQQVPQLGGRTASQPNRPSLQDRRPGVPPGARQVPPKATQRPPVLTRPSPSVRTERKAPGANPPDARPGGQSLQRRDNSEPPGRQERGNQAQQRGAAQSSRSSSDSPERRALQ